MMSDSVVVPDVNLPDLITGRQWAVFGEGRCKSVIWHETYLQLLTQLRKGI